MYFYFVTGSVIALTFFVQISFLKSIVLLNIWVLLAITFHSRSLCSLTRLCKVKPTQESSRHCITACIMNSRELYIWAAGSTNQIQKRDRLQGC